MVGYKHLWDILKKDDFFNKIVLDYEDNEIRLEKILEAKPKQIVSMKDELLVEIAIASFKPLLGCYNRRKNLSELWCLLKRNSQLYIFTGVHQECVEFREKYFKLFGKDSKRTKLITGYGIGILRVTKNLQQYL